MSFIKDIKTRAFILKYPLRKYKQGQVLIHADDIPSSIYYLQEGRVKRYAVTDNSNEVFVEIIRPKDAFPIAQLFFKPQKGYFYEALDDVVLRIIPNKDMEEFLEKNPSKRLLLLTSAYETIERLMYRMTKAQGYSAYAKLVQRLDEECMNCERDKKTGYYVLNLHEYQLAEQAGISTETASRELKKLRKNGWIDVNRKTIIVKNLPQIRKVLDKTV